MLSSLLIPMFNRLAFVFANTIILIGIIFLFLDILDINEGFRLYLSIPLSNTIFLASVSVSVALIAAYKFTNSGSPELLGIGCAALTLATGFMIYSWFTASELGVRKNIYDCTVLLSSAMHLCGFILLKSKFRFTRLKTGQRILIITLCYAVIISIILAATWMLYQNILPLLNVSRNLLRGTGAVLCLITAVIYYKHSSKSGLIFHYWYSLGLMLLAFGIIIASLGPLEGRLVWWGRLSLYIGGVYFLTGILKYHQIPKTNAELWII